MPSKRWKLVGSIALAIAAIVVALAAYRLVAQPQVLVPAESPEQMGDSAEATLQERMETGKEYLDGGKVEAAIALFRDAAAGVPGNLDVQLNLARSYWAAGKLSEAAQQAKFVLGGHKNSAAALYLVGCAEASEGNLDDASKALQQSLRVDPTKAVVALLLGEVHHAAGRTEEAARAYEAAEQSRDDLSPSARSRLTAAVASLAGGAGRAPATQGTFICEPSTHTAIRVEISVAQPPSPGIDFTLVDDSQDLFGADADAFTGPLALIDLTHDGAWDLIVNEPGAGLRVLGNDSGRFERAGAPLAATVDGGFEKILVGDLNNSGVEDVVAINDEGVRVFRLAQGATPTDATDRANLESFSGRDGALLDVDNTGTLDLVLVSADPAGLRIARNMGSLYFLDATHAFGVSEPIPGASALAIDDWNDDEVMDLALAAEGGPLVRFRGVRGGDPFVASPDAEAPRGSLVVAGDLDHDLRPDVVTAAGDRLAIAYADGRREKLSATTGAVRVIRLVDLDNDGWLDLVAAGRGLHAWRNEGRTGLQPIDDATGLSGLGAPEIDGMVAADFDNDCDTDLIVSLAGGGLRFVRNQGGNANRQARLRLSTLR